MELAKRPQAHLAKKVLPHGLRLAIENIFAQNIFSCALAGGTALAGYYAGHRRSDDIDLFVADEMSFKAAVLAVENLVNQGGTLSSARKSASYFHVLCGFHGHSFTVDIVLDQNFHKVVELEKVGVVYVSSLLGLLMTKAATLVSRCSEKDLYDLIWLFNAFPETSLQEFIALGQRIDTGLNGESLLVSLAGATLNEKSCGFAEDFGVSRHQVFLDIRNFSKAIQKELSLFLPHQQIDTRLKRILKSFS